LLTPDKGRRVTIADALADTEAITLSAPAHVIRELGLNPLSVRNIRTSVGRSQTTAYGPVRLTIQDRDCTQEVLEVSDETPAVIERVPLACLDLVPDSTLGKLIGNPAHGGDWIVEMY
jgi:hypothetical protein